MPPASDTAPEPPEKQAAQPAASEGKKPADLVAQIKIGAREKNAKRGSGSINEEAAALEQAAAGQRELNKLKTELGTMGAWFGAKAHQPGNIQGLSVCIAGGVVFLCLVGIFAVEVFSTDASFGARSSPFLTLGGAALGFIFGKVGK